MSEYNKDKLFWFKLKDDFFKRHDIKIIRAMPNGTEYVIFYLQLLCESLAHDGKLRFNESIPYNEQMLSVITDTNIDVVRGAMEVLQTLHLVEIYDDKTIYMTQIERLIGNTTVSAEKKKLQRENVALLRGGGQRVDKCPPEIEIEQDIERDINNCLLIKNKIIKDLCVYAHLKNLPQAQQDVVDEIVDIIAKSDRGEELGEMQDKQALRVTIYNIVPRLMQTKSITDKSKYVMRIVNDELAVTKL